MKKIKKIWKHTHEYSPKVIMDFKSGIPIEIPREPPFRYMVSYEKDDGELYIREVVAVDELDVIKQLTKE